LKAVFPLTVFVVRKRIVWENTGC